VINSNPRKEQNGMARKPIDEQIREQEERLKQLKAKASQLQARERAALKAKQRQEDTHRKIQHGGLVVLAGLAELDKGVLLGALLDVADKLNSDQRKPSCLGPRLGAITC
jgi:vacuolar-type H+-ATPase subunit I/STV1